ncbi:hypothetical protein ABB37_01972 [Leptomonas pyrrhocoris]|uniref:Uncharacterized protein n=1 Tax=Leptomonas pyrrhocoris TaxID=157538 RepID=A0A0N0VGR4_LEPPY|nr:hypothetical protein ABB37_01972 [Leptomonas pyrrhocoris]KPA83724.1 hypothetical protein ABB37_01972 [Leptomonas pyrrhocoris]|eukprot:XP_015662163.1 hypothetical protein ABB37_01972 [Leptomonas pyrrhocoris]
MKAATPTARAPRPPSAQCKRAPRAPHAAVSTAVSETKLRRHLSEVEMRLRDIDDDTKRIQMHHEQELATLEKDNTRLHDRLEELRMEECMTPAETRAMQEHTDLSHGALGHHGGSKLLGATSAKYLSTKAEVEAKWRECAHAEQQVEEVRRQLTVLRQRRQALKREVLSTRASAGAKMSAAQRFKVQAREQLRGLEEQAAREQERFSNMVFEAKRTRSAIDALLVKQTGNEKMYNKRYDALLDKRKEMAYLMEVYNCLCEERQRVNAEVQEVKAYLAEESSQYEAAFQELLGVADENATVKAANQEKMEKLRGLIRQTKAEREALEAQNKETKAAFDRHRQRRVGRLVNNSSSREEAGRPSSGSGERNAAHRLSDNDSPENDDGNTHDRSGAETSLGSTTITALDGRAQQVREFEDYFQRLASIVQSDAIEDVVGFIEVAADERYHCFDEMNALKRDIAELTAEKAALKAQLTHGGTIPRASASAANRSREAGEAGVGAAAAVAAADVHPPASPTASLAALAKVTSIEELAAAAAEPASVQVGRRKTEPGVSPLRSSSASSPPAPAGSVTQDSARRAKRMRELQVELNKTRDAAIEEEQQHEECDAVLAQVIAQVNEVFRGLGCSAAELRAATGLEGVQPSTLLTSLSLVEQRTEAYLLAYSRGQHLQQQQDEQHRQNAESEGAAASPVGVHNAARPLLRRPDLLPKAKGGAAVHVTSQQLPRLY